ncbi:predicted protein [Histoplasma capsulatum G186AR]|uniref:Uncharacterized protein n=2 Tax=Ajellomyces capsulatus TaxID=5037 RepID=C0P143_AJECG|nr:uncharacterized protein HCBG_09123 [Histoplasma capsulatum G186AR]EEH02679.1 predicted protein [Histoplasma capsulatum G186AR]
MNQAQLTSALDSRVPQQLLHQAFKMVCISQMVQIAILGAGLAAANPIPGGDHYPEKEIKTVTVTEYKTAYKPVTEFKEITKFVTVNHPVTQWKTMTITDYPKPVTITDYKPVTVVHTQAVTITAVKEVIVTKTAVHEKPVTHFQTITVPGKPVPVPTTIVKVQTVTSKCEPKKHDGGKYPEGKYDDGKGYDGKYGAGKDDGKNDDGKNEKNDNESKGYDTKGDY